MQSKLTFEEAQNQLKFPTAIQDRYRSRPLLIGKSRNSKEPTDYGSKQPNASQLLFAALAMEREASPLMGGMLTDNTSFNNKISILNHVAYDAERIERAWEDASKNDKKKIDCRPTMVVCPPELINAWVQEFKKNYQGILKLKHFYSSQNQNIDADTLDSNGELAKNWLDTECDGKHPEHARVVILTSYETLTERTLLSKPKSEFQGDKKQYESVRSFEHDPCGNRRRQLPIFMGSWADRVPTLDRDNTGANAINQTKIYDSRFAGRFKRLILDEGHKVSNSSTYAHRACYTIKAKHKWVVTETPLARDGGDWLGYLNLFWQEEFLLLGT